MTYFFAGFALAILIAAWFTLERQAAVYEQMVRLVENERDAAKQEAKVFRGLLFPVMNRAEQSCSSIIAGNSEKVQRPPSPAQAMPAQSAQSFYRPPRRVSFRQLFNQARRLTNTPQQRTDALASALTKAKIPTGE